VVKEILVPDKITQSPTQTDQPWRSFNTIPTNGKPVCAVDISGNIYKIYANPELDRRMFLGWKPWEESIPEVATEARFFIDHDMIHDRVTGKHITTDPDTPFCDGILACCRLLNELTTPLTEGEDQITIPLTWALYDASLQPLNQVWVLKFGEFSVGEIWRSAKKWAWIVLEPVNTSRGGSEASLETAKAELILAVKKTRT
jgi:hypothetical protein